MVAEVRSHAAASVSPGRYLPRVPNVYQLKVTLQGTNPPIWRRLLVPGNLNFARLHYMEVTAGEIEAPRCLAGERACPPENCGGVWRFADLLRGRAERMAAEPEGHEGA